jgi:manganese/iron transport system substrate-binding protein
LYQGKGNRESKTENHTMNNNFFFKGFTAIVLFIGLFGCQSTPTTSPETNSKVSSDRPLVVATTSVICDLIRQVAADTIDLKCLVAPGEDPHVYQPKPEDRKAIDKAKLILYAGYNFDPNLIKLIKASSNSAPKIAVHELAVPKPLMGEEHEHSAEEKLGEGEQSVDPHVWHDVKNGIAMVKAIANSLGKIEANKAAVYDGNAKKITDELIQLDSWIRSKITTIPADRRKLVATHDALGYYVKAYGLDFQGALEGLSTEAAPTAARVSELVKEIEQTGVPTIYAETNNNSKLIETVAKEAMVKVSDRELYADGLGEKGSEADTYQKMMIANTQAIVEGLGGQYTAFEAKRRK